jgi:hypothetical protein
MGMLQVARGLGAVCVVMATFAGCGPSPAPTDPSGLKLDNGGAPNAKAAAATEAYKHCKAEEDKEGGDSARMEHCYESWLDEYRDVADQGQVRHATRMAAKHPVQPTHPDGPAIDEHKDAPPKPIVMDDHPPPKPQGSGGENPFPPQTVGYEDCWKGAPLTGNYITDYNNLVARCGRPTGMLPYSRVMEGALSDSHKGDVYTVKLVGGGCYRFFAVAGGSIKDIDIGLATMEDKMLAADKYTQPVAIIEWKQPVCVQHDVMFKLIVARDGGGEGGYGFGVWFKPGQG